MDALRPNQPVEVDATEILRPRMELDKNAPRATATVHPDGHITVAYERGAAAYPILPGEQGYLEITALAREAIAKSIPAGPVRPDDRAADTITAPQ
jgi:hypothetical protein